MEEAIEIANKKAPEHIELHVKNPDKIAKGLKNYGSLFIGSYTGAVFGDYSAGINHTLPTNFCARYTGGLCVKDFLKFQTILRITEEGFNRMEGPTRVLAELEGLKNHAESIDIRKTKLNTL